MSDHEPATNGQKLTRRSILKRGGTVGVAAAAGALVAPQLASATGKENDHHRTLRLTVMDACWNKGPSAEVGAGPAPQPGVFVNNFVVVGDIVEVDGSALKEHGRYYCKGVIFAFSNLAVEHDKARCAVPTADTYVDQYFSIPGMGSINGAGTEGDTQGLAAPNRFDDLIVTGGTGMFKCCCGDYGSLKPLFMDPEKKVPNPPGSDGTEGEGPRQFGGTGIITFEFNLWCRDKHRRHHHERRRRRRRRRWWEGSYAGD